MSISQEQYDQMMAYFEGKLPAQEEISFLEAVAADEAWRKEFDWEMMLRHGQFEDEKIDADKHAGSEFAPADQYIRDVQSAVSAEKKNSVTRKPARVIPLKRVFAIAAMLVIALGLFIAGYFFFREETPAIVKKDPPPAIDTNIAVPKQIQPPVNRKEDLVNAGREKGKKLYQEYYKQYAATEDDPVEVSKYLYAYEAGNYKQVISATKNELGTKGANDNHTELENYLLLYQGVSYLQLKDAANARTKFNRLLRQPKLSSIVKEDALWYLSLAELSVNDLHAANRSLTILASNKKGSRYRERAATMLKEL